MTLLLLLTLAWQGGIASLELDFEVVPFGLGVGFSFLMTTCCLGVGPAILDAAALFSSVFVLRDDDIQLVWRQHPPSICMF